MKQENNVKDVVRKESLELLYYLERIYEDFDKMNCHWHNLLENLNDEEFPYLFDLWKTFPTYNTLNDIKEIVEKIYEENKEEIVEKK